MTTHFSILACKRGRGPWWATVHRVAKELNSTEQLNNNNKNNVLATLVSRVSFTFAVLRNHASTSLNILKDSNFP